MSEANVDVICRQNAAVRRGDLDALAATIDPHILIRTDARWPEQRIYGRGAALAWYRELWRPAELAFRMREGLTLGIAFLVGGACPIPGFAAGVGGGQGGSAIWTFREGAV